MDLGWVEEHYGTRSCIIGNVDSSRTLPFGTPNDVAHEAREPIDIAAPGGGYVLASDHSLHDGIPVENTLELARVGREYRGCVFIAAVCGSPVDDAGLLMALWGRRVLRRTADDAGCQASAQLDEDLNRKRQGTLHL
jgi:hypothetical protein